MDINNMKNIVVLKNLPSNMVEEAFVILKSNVKIQKRHLIDNKKGKLEKEEKNITKECVVREAEMIIQEYIDKVEKNSLDIAKNSIKMNKKYNRLKAVTVFLSIFSLLSIISSFFR